MNHEKAIQARGLLHRLADALVSADRYGIAEAIRRLRQLGISVEIGRGQAEHDRPKIDRPKIDRNAPASARR